MLLCEVALGNIKEVGIPKGYNVDEDEDENENENEKASSNDDEEEEEEDNDQLLDLKRFQSQKAVGRRIPDPKHTITRSHGLFLN